MSEHDNDHLLDRVADTLRREPGLGVEVNERVMAGIRSGAASHRHRGWTMGLGIGAMAAAAALALWFLLPADGTSPVPATGEIRRFALDAPGAESVAVVGDFNDWDPAASPLIHSGGGTWTVEVALPSGSHRYAFVIDGNRWLADPTSAGRVVDDFGDGNSIVIVEGAS